MGFLAINGVGWIVAVIIQLNPAIGLVIGIASLGAGAWLWWRFEERENKQEETKANNGKKVRMTTSTATLGEKQDETRKHDTSLQDIALIGMINKRVMINHGHGDQEGIIAEHKDGVSWTAILTNKCTRCDRPRNQKEGQ